MSKEDLELLAEEAVDFATAIEAACVAFKMSVAKIFGPKPEAKTDLPGSVDLSKLPWRSYQTKQAAKENEAGWIFANTQEAEPLVATLKTKDRAQIGGFEVRFSGANKQFIARKPLKK